MGFFLAIFFIAIFDPLSIERFQPITAFHFLLREEDGVLSRHAVFVLLPKCLISGLFHYYFVDLLNF